MDKPVLASPSSSAARRAQARADLRAKILAAAAELFVAGGYQGLSMRQLAERIGYTAPTIYLYFANKDALLFALLEEGYNELGERLAAVAAAEPVPIARLAALGREYVAFGRERPMHYQLMFMQRADFLQARLAARANRVDPLAVLQEAVAAAASAGAIRAADPQVITLSLWAAVHGLVGLLLIGPPLPEEQIRALVDTTIAAMLAGLTHA
ncbi:MAG: TetR/AcrR family transcriptional regulator [Chloroflexales bacterium]|nr:TetR/AcrR family transcriptional regulator [Chloroflexales bacterium]